MSPRIDRTNWVLLLSLVWVTVWLYFTWPYWEDDAYIHLEYARSLAEGHGFVFNNRLSNGDTSPLWVLLLTLPMRFGVDGLWAGKLLTVVCCVATLVMLWHFTRMLLEDLAVPSGARPAWPMALFVSSPYFCYWAFSGMEAVAAAGWVMLQSSLLMPHRASLRSLLGAAACLGLGPLLRPELSLMAVVGLPFLLWQARSVLQPSAPRTRLWVTAAILLALSLPLSVWTAYALQAFGHVLPNTNAAKQAPPGAWVSLRLLQVGALGFPGLILLASALAMPGLRKPVHDPGNSPQRRAWHGVPFTALPLLAWALLVGVFYMVNHTHVQTRYVLVLAPGLLALVCVLAVVRVRPWALYTATLSSIAVGTGISLLLVIPHMRNKIELIGSTGRMASYIEATLPPGTPVAVYAIGQFGYLLRDHELVDVGGITRPSASRFLYDEKARVGWARAEGARYFIWGEAPEPGAELVQAFDAHNVGWFMNPGAYAQSAPVRLWRLPASPKD